MHRVNLAKWAAGTGARAAPEAERARAGRGSRRGPASAVAIWPARGAARRIPSLPARGKRVVEKQAESPLMQKLLERIVRSPQHLLALETTNVAEMLAQMRMLAMRGGTSIYVWDPENGIDSLRESGLHVPGSKRIGDALRYVLQSTHFGIYLFVDFAEHLRPVDTVLLRRISRMQTANQRKLVFVGHGFELPEELEGMFERIAAQGRERPRLKLRDGRWVE